MAKFKPGQSGNPKGRPKGARGKLSDEALLLELQRGDSFALENIRNIMGNEREGGNTRLRAATAWLGFSLEMRKRIEAALNKSDPEESKTTLEEDEDGEPLLSFTAIEGGKK